MPKAPIIVYDHNMRKVAMLENAFAIGYEMPLNSLWRASFSLPANDPKNAECRSLYHVEIFDENERIELFRIIPNTMRRSNDGQTVSYECEHVLATLLDDVMFQFHTVGNLGVHTQNVLQYILDQQVVTRWQLGDVQFSKQFEYNWENENLLGALFSVPKPFTEEYMWSYDTTVYPWKLNLVEPPPAVETYIRYGVNMQGIEKTTDPTSLCNRLYGLGFGEGVNQLTFASINSGIPYIEDAVSQSNYGVVSRIFVDRRFESPETLMARCQALLNELKNPRVTYSTTASDIHRLTGQRIYKFVTGSKIRVKDEELGEDFVARLVNVRKTDLRGQPGNVELEISNRPLNIAGTIAELQDRQRIEAVYAQGATNLDSHNFADNCDPTHPAILKFWIPEETARINKVMLSYQVEAFRSYERAIEAAPATTSGPSSTSTTAAGGQTTSGPSSTSTTAAGGQTTSGPSSTSTTAAGGQTTSGPSSTSTTAAGGQTTSEASSTDTTDNTEVRSNTQAGIVKYHDNHDTYGAMGSAGLHNHGIPNGQQLLTPDGTVTWNASGNHEHPVAFHYHTFWSDPHTHGMNHTHEIDAHTHGMNHTHEIDAHTHGMAHTHEIAAHTHGMDHTHEIAAHTHGMDHTHTIPAHTHMIEYGIFEGPTPTEVTVEVDGNEITGLGTDETDIDIIPYLSKDGSGKVNRGWHVIKITPNNLGRIVAAVFTQVFVQSRGGGNY